jgi:hypothetical protein
MIPATPPNEGVWIVEDCGCIEDVLANAGDGGCDEIDYQRGLALN